MADGKDGGAGGWIHGLGGRRTGGGRERGWSRVNDGLLAGRDAEGEL